MLIGYVDVKVKHLGLYYDPQPTASPTFRLRKTCSSSADPKYFADLGLQYAHLFSLLGGTGKDGVCETK